MQFVKSHLGLGLSVVLKKKKSLKKSILRNKKMLQFKLSLILTLQFLSFQSRGKILSPMMIPSRLAAGDLVDVNRLTICSTMLSHAK